MISKELQTRVDEQVLIRKRLLKGKGKNIDFLEEEVYQLLKDKVLTGKEADLLLIQLQDVPFSMRPVDIIFESLEDIKKLLGS